MPDDTIPLVLIPGLGADAGIWKPQLAHFGARAVVPVWTPPRAVDEPVRDYVRRWTAELDAAGKLPLRFYLAGVSFGGMAGMFLADHLCRTRPGRVAGLFLVGGCGPGRWRVGLPYRIGERLCRPIPDGVGLGLLRKVIPGSAVWHELLDCGNAETFYRVAGRARIEIVRWAARMLVVTHDSPDLEPLRRCGCPVRRAHGRLDRVVPIREDEMTPGSDLVIPRGRHLIHMTHADVINRWLESYMTRTCVFR